MPQSLAISLMPLPLICIILLVFINWLSLCGHQFRPSCFLLARITVSSLYLLITNCTGSGCSVHAPLASRSAASKGRESESLIELCGRVLKTGAERAAFQNGQRWVCILFHIDDGRIQYLIASLGGLIHDRRRHISGRRRW